MLSLWIDCLISCAEAWVFLAKSLREIRAFGPRKTVSATAESSSVHWVKVDLTLYSNEFVKSPVNSQQTHLGLRAARHL